MGIFEFSKSLTLNLLLTLKFTLMVLLDVFDALQLLLLKLSNTLLFSLKLFLDFQDILIFQVQHLVFLNQFLVKFLYLDVQRACLALEFFLFSNEFGLNILM